MGTPLKLTKACLFLSFAASIPAWAGGYGNLPLSFEADQGQAEARVQYLAHAAMSPAFFPFTAKYPAAVHTDGVLVGKVGLLAGAKFAPAKPGETILLFGTGFGPSNPELPAGKLVTAAKPEANKVTVTVGGQAAKVVFAGTTGSGLVQLNVTIPAGTSDGDAALTATVAGANTQTGVLVTVQQ